MRSTVDPRPAPAPVVAIDPRIRERRIGVARTAGRRRLQRLVYVGLVIAVAAAFAGALRSPLLDVDDVVVRGAVRTDPAALRAEAAIDPGTQLMDVDLTAVGRRVAALPWVDEVHVRRRLDGTVVLEVTERVPAAVVGSGPAALVIDVEGRVLARADGLSEAAALVRVDGLPGVDSLLPGDFLPAGAGPAPALAQDLAAGLPGVVAAVRSGTELRADLVAGGEVRFGGPDRLPAKVRALTTMLERVDLTCLDVLDVRVPTSPVLTRREPCS